MRTMTTNIHWVKAIEVDQPETVEGCSGYPYTWRRIRFVLSDGSSYEVTAFGETENLTLPGEI